MPNKKTYIATALLLLITFVASGKETENYTVLRAEKSFASQVVAEGTAYVVRNNFDLHQETVILPEGCKLIFEGGGIGNGTVDFTRCANQQIYYSWFTDFGTCNRSLLYLNNKELVIDKDIVTSESFVLPKNNFSHQNITIRGTVSTREARPKIVAQGVPCFKIYGHFFTFMDLCLTVKDAPREVPCIDLECPMEGLNDVDCVVSHCHFFHNGGGIGVKCKGRGLTVENCIFQTPATAIPNNRLDISAISLFPEAEPKYPVSNGTQWHDLESSGRGIIIRNNRLHLSNPGSLVGLYANPNCPDWAFNGVQIVGNLVDAEGSICVITAKNNGTLITNNVNYARRASSSMYISNACDMLITNNILGQLRIEQAQYTDSYDVVFERDDLISEKMRINDYSSEIHSVLVSNNIFGSYKGSVLCNECNAFCAVSISNNLYGKHAFECGTRNLSILSKSIFCNISNTFW